MPFAFNPCQPCCCSVCCTKTPFIPPAGNFNYLCATINVNTYNSTGSIIDSTGTLGAYLQYFLSPSSDSPIRPGYYGIETRWYRDFGKSIRSFSHSPASGQTRRVSWCQRVIGGRLISAICNSGDMKFCDGTPLGVVDDDSQIINNCKNIGMQVAIMDNPNIDDFDYHHFDGVLYPVSTPISGSGNQCINPIINISRGSPPYVSGYLATAGHNCSENFDCWIDYSNRYSLPSLPYEQGWALKFQSECAYLSGVQMN